jgi:catechol 2,3-dioxygenase-like lactoylglutathione lyase family enzyme
MTAPAYLEHANLTVRDLDAATRFLLTALPDWRVRGEGTMDWFGRSMRWRHVGNDLHYLALQDGATCPPVNWQGHAGGVKHLGLVVADLDAVVQRLAAAGHAIDHPGGRHPHRRSVYYTPDDLVQLEFVQYLSDRPAERNAYDAP